MRVAERLRMYAAYLRKGAALPRPGASLPIEFASGEHVSRYPELRDDFVIKVLGLEWAFLSDESSLWDFHEGLDNNSFYQKTGDVYGVDVSHIFSANIAEILSEIMLQTGTFPEDLALKAIRLDREARMGHVAGLPAPSRDS